MQACLHRLLTWLVYTLSALVFFVGMFVDIRQCESKCIDRPDEVHYTYQIEEETPVPVHIADLTTDICVERGKGNNASSEVMQTFILFPSTQPYYSYFEIRQAKVRKIADGTQETKFKQYLILIRSIDREEMCENPTPSSLSSNIFLKRSVGVHPKSHCSCEIESGWCTIYLSVLTSLSRVSDGATIDRLTLSDSNKFLTLGIRIIDINDNAPSFQPAEYKIFLSEAELPGSKFRLPSAIDKDLGRNAQLSYGIQFLNSSPPHQSSYLPYKFSSNTQINERQPTFSLETSTKSTDLFIKLQVQLDREKKDSYDIVITATDQALAGPKTGHLFLRVFLIDVNDFTPIFDQPVYTFYVPESTSSGTSVGSVHAEDNDSEANGKIDYFLHDTHFNDSCQSKWKNRFRIDSETGVIRVHSVLDREQEHKVVFHVEARDHGNPVRSGVARVVIYLVDENDNSPFIRLWGKRNLIDNIGLIDCNGPEVCSLLTVEKQMRTTISVTEFINVESVIAIVETWDADELERGDVSCTVNNPDFALQPAHRLPAVTHLPGKSRPSNTSSHCASHKPEKSSNFYQVVTLHGLDWELKPQNYVPIVCYDADNTMPRSSTLLLQITVKDENDNVPVFNLPIIMSPAIWINKDAFLATVQSVSQTQYRTSQDVSLSSSKRIEIIIPETAEQNTTIAKFSGHDPDGAHNGAMHFILREVGQPDVVSKASDLEVMTMIDIDEGTGRLYTTTSLLHVPAKQWHSFEVVLSDNGTPALATALLISICIQIVNQHSPVIHLYANIPSGTWLSTDALGNHTSLNVSENDPPGTPIGRLKVEDLDRGEAGQISFWLTDIYQMTSNGTSLSQRHPFLLNNRTGLVTTTRVLDREQDGDQFFLHVYAKDNVTPTKTALQNISVNIVDLNDNVPYFLLPIKSCFAGNSSADSETELDFFRLAENFTYVHVMPNFVASEKTSNPGLLFKAHDSDSGNNSVISYFISPSCSSSPTRSQLNRMFNIVNNTGCLTPTRYLLDQTLPAVYHLRVVAQDNGAYQQLWSALELSIFTELTNNHSLTLKIEGFVSSTNCDLDAHNAHVETLQAAQNLDDLTPLMRVLLGVTTLAGLILLTGVVFVLVKRPKWIVGRTFVGRKPQQAKIDIFQCRTVHNEIERWSPNLHKRDGQFCLNAAHNRCVIHVETGSPFMSLSQKHLEMNQKPQSVNTIKEPDIPLSEYCQSLELTPCPIYVHLEPNPDDPSTVYFRGLLANQVEDTGHTKHPVSLEPLDSCLVQLTDPGRNEDCNIFPTCVCNSTTVYHR